MVYKIIGKFDAIDFGKLLSKLSKNFLCMYVGDVLYLALKDYNDLDNTDELLKKNIKPTKLFFIEEITDKNIKKQIEVVQQWCIDNLKRLNIQKIELEQQDKFRETWEAMDKIEEELKAKLSEKLTQELTQENSEEI